MCNVRYLYAHNVTTTARNTRTGFPLLLLIKGIIQHNLTS
jgi:hypothetical protein